MNDPLVVSEPLGGWRAPWPSMLEIADALPVDRWALVGGLMVQAHSLAARVETTRVTLDVDAAVRVETGVYSYAEAAAALARLGYAVDESTRLAYRFARGADIVDLMVPDHGASTSRHSRRDVMPVTGGRQAMGRVQLMEFQSDDSRATVPVPVPSLHGALVLKAAAHIVDSRDRDRHLLDAITLLACIVDAREIVHDLRGSDRKRLTHILRALQERPLVAAQAPTDTLLLAQRTAADLRRLLS